MRLVVISAGFAIAALLALAVVLAVGAHDRRQIDDLAKSTNEALCTFKHEIQIRADDTEVFIVELEHGRRQPIPGITIVDLKRSLASQRDTLAALNGLNCG